MGHMTVPGTLSNRVTPPLDPPTPSMHHANTAEGNLFMALIAGSVAALTGALIWAGVTAATGYQIGWMAVGVGFLVGLAVRLGGNGRTAIFGLIGAALALGGCFAGNVFAGCYFIAAENSIPMMDVVAALDLTLAGEILGVMFSPIDLLFYGLAVYEGFRFSLAGE